MANQGESDWRQRRVLAPISVNKRHRQRGIERRYHPPVLMDLVFIQDDLVIPS